MRAILIALVVICVTAPAFAQSAPAKPLDPITAIIDAFKTHDVVALGEGDHTNEQGAAFRNRLYHDPRFQAVVNDIVVESGNGRHQAMMDRYIAGENVPEKELRMAWVETTQPHDIWDKDIYADMFRTIREINRTLPKERQLRVLLGDSPYDSAVATFQPRLDSFTTDLILRETIAKKRKALTVYGAMHYLRREPQFPPLPGQPPVPPPGTIVSLLEKAGVKVFSIWTFMMITGGQELPALQPDIARWPNPSLALIKDTTLGVAPFTFYYPKGAGRMGRRGPNGLETFDIGEMIGGTMQEQSDAVLYMGPKTGITYASLSRSLCADPDYVEMRAKRMSVMGVPPPPPGALPAASPADMFRLRCKAAASGPRSTPTPGFEALTRRALASAAKGEPLVEVMAPALAQSAQANRENRRQLLARLGPLQSLTFTGSGALGGDIYRGAFANGACDITITAGPDGKLIGLQYGPFLQSPAQRAATFRANDGNADGKLGKAEYATLLTSIGNAARLDNLFAQLDADQDGQITPKEFGTEPQ